MTGINEEGRRVSLDVDMPMTSAPRYARFSRRFRGIVIDWAIAMAFIFGTLLLASLVGNDSLSRVLGFMVVIVLVLYEPILVSVYGSTLGHYFTNLRVVDERSGGNVSFPKACARVLIKGVLGWYSFVILAATRRNQAIHDLLTRSTVQIRDPAKARSGQYVVERTELSDPGMPSWMRRLVVTVIWLALAMGALIAFSAAMFAAGMVSARCIDKDYCSGSERIVLVSTEIALLAMTALIIALGWKGRLFGARKG
jgi:uncharacterized RDD family membrane protein YckC